MESVNDGNISMYSDQCEGGPCTCTHTPASRKPGKEKKKTWSGQAVCTVDVDVDIGVG
jgi:hypothetical protein